MVFMNNGVTFTKDILRKFRETLSRFSKVEEKAFLLWFITAYSEKELSDPSIIVTDGKKDGEIDAIIFDSKTFVIQSKFSESPFVGQPKLLSIGDYTKFDNTISNFGSKQKFEEYLKTIDNSLKANYRKLFEIYQKDPDKVFWIYAAFFNESSTGKSRCINSDKIKFYY